VWWLAVWSGGVLVGGGVVWYLMTQSHVEAETAQHTPSVTSEQPGAATEEPVGGETATPMTVADMAPMHYFVPALDAYSEILPSTQFEGSYYGQGFTSLEVPDDSQQSVWYADGGVLGDNRPGTTGTTMLASHVSTRTERGVLYYLSTLQGGELVYVKDAAGEVSTWRVTDVFTRPHTEFPR